MNTFSSIEEELERKGKIVYSNRGRSMYPLIRQNSDLVIIEKRPADSLRKRDAILFKSDGKFILHRIVRVTESGFITRGDNNIAEETVGRDQVLGLLTGVIRGDRTVSSDSARYRIYKRVIPARVCYLKLRRRVSSLLHRSEDNASPFAAFAGIYKILTHAERRSVIISGVLALILSLLEIVSVNAILPYMNVMISPEKAETIPVLRTIYANCSGISFVLIMSVLLCLLYVFKGMFAMFYEYVSEKALKRIRTHYSVLLYRYYLHRPYEFFLNQNSVVLLRRVTEITSTAFNGIIAGTLSAAEQLLIVMGVIISLFSFGSSLISATVICFLILFYFLYNYSKKRLRSISIEINGTVKRYRSRVLEYFRLVREVKYGNRIDDTVSSAEQYDKSIVSLLLRRVLVSTLSGQILEVGAVVTCVSIIVGNSIGVGDISGSIAQLSLYGVAVLKLRQTLSRLLQDMNYVADNSGSYNEVIPDVLLASEWEKTEGQETRPSLPLRESIVLEDVSYRYPGTESDVLTDISMELRKGQVVGIDGVSGIGKSTLLYLITGMLIPSRGRVLVDGSPIAGNEDGWQKNIGYISQNISLMDASILENVALGVPQDRIDRDAVLRVLKAAELEDVVNSLPDRENTVIGDNGIRFSGGERQRIGIARALYSGAKILVCDEATNSLDAETEEKVMDSLMALAEGMTVIIISHSRKPLSYCDTVYSLADGKIASVSTKEKK